MDTDETQPLPVHDVTTPSRLASNEIIEEMETPVPTDKLRETFQRTRKPADALEPPCVAAPPAPCAVETPQPEDTAAKALETAVEGAQARRVQISCVLSIVAIEYTHFCKYLPRRSPACMHLTTIACV